MTEDIKIIKRLIRKRQKIVDTSLSTWEDTWSVGRSDLGKFKNVAILLISSSFWAFCCILIVSAKIFTNLVHLFVFFEIRIVLSGKVSLQIAPSCCSFLAFFCLVRQLIDSACCILFGILVVSDRMSLRTDSSGFRFLLSYLTGKFLPINSSCWAFFGILLILSGRISLLTGSSCCLLVVLPLLSYLARNLY